MPRAFFADNANTLTAQASALFNVRAGVDVTRRARVRSSFNPVVYDSRSCDRGDLSSLPRECWLVPRFVKILGMDIERVFVSFGTLVFGGSSDGGATSSSWF